MKFRPPNLSRDHHRRERLKIFKKKKSRFNRYTKSVHKNRQQYWAVICRYY